MRNGARLPGLALMASSLPGMAAAQDPTPEMRLVQAFQTYCMATAADAKRVAADVREVGQTHVRGTLTEITMGLDLVIEKDPYSRVRILFDGPPGGQTHTCRVDVSPEPVDARIALAALERDLGLGAGVSTVLPERRNNPHSGGGHPRIELTHWKTHLDDAEAEIELRVTADSPHWPSLKLSVRRNVGWGWGDLLRYFFKTDGK
jgi:hypothetical protein